MARFFFGVGVIALFLSAFAFAVLKEGKPVPSFQANLLDGKAVVVRVDKGKLSVQLKGGKANQTLKPKVLVLEFWATWCPPCHLTSKWLAKLHQKYHKKGLIILAISVDEDGRASVVPFVKSEKTPYLVALDPKAEIANRFKVEGLPTIYVVNEKGVIARVFEGMPNDHSELESAIRSAGIRLSQVSR